MLTTIFTYGAAALAVLWACVLVLLMLWVCLLFVAVALLDLWHLLAEVRRALWWRRMAVKERRVRRTSLRWWD